MENLLKKQNEDNQRHRIALSEDFHEQLKIVCEGVKFCQEKLLEHDKRFDVLEKDVKILKDDVSIIKLDVKEIKRELRQKVDRKEFTGLKRKVETLT